MRRLVSITLLRTRYLQLAAALIISLTLTPSLSLAEKYVYKVNPFNTSAQMEYVPKSYKLRLNALENRYEWAPKHARLKYDYGLKQWRYIPGIIPR